MEKAHVITRTLPAAFDAVPAQLVRLPQAPETLGRTVSISRFPHNLCYIRGAFGWKQASAEEQAIYECDMLPVYREGAEYLRDNPEESNCISMRMADAIDVAYDSGVQSNSIGWFVSLKDLEQWVRSHPRHLAIMSTITGFMEQFGFKPKLNLGHEVAVIPQGALKAWYNNCHRETGFLPYFEAD